MFCRPWSVDRWFSRWLLTHVVSQNYVIFRIQWFFQEQLIQNSMIFPWFFHFNKFQDLFIKFNDFSMILKQIWISMIFQELWEPCIIMGISILARCILYIKKSPRLQHLPSFIMDFSKLMIHDVNVEPVFRGYFQHKDVTQYWSSDSGDILRYWYLITVFSIFPLWD